MINTRNKDYYIYMAFLHWANIYLHQMGQKLKYDGIVMLAYHAFAITGKDMAFPHWANVYLHQMGQ